MSAAVESFGKPSASFVMSMLRSYDPGPHPEFVDAIHLLNWNDYADAVSAMQRSVPAVLKPDAFPLLLAQQEAHENSGAEIISYIADTIPEPRHRTIMKRHAADEGRHSRVFLALRQLLSPKKAVVALTNSGPDPFIADYRGDLASFLWDTHFAEISSVFYLESVRSAISHPEATIARKIDAALARVIADERRHVAGTASILSELFLDDPLMVQRMQMSFDDYASAIRERAARRSAKPT